MFYFLIGILVGFVAYIGIYFIVRARNKKKAELGDKIIEEKKDDRKE